VVSEQEVVCHQRTNLVDQKRNENHPDSISQDPETEPEEFYCVHEDIETLGDVLETRERLRPVKGHSALTCLDYSTLHFYYQNSGGSYSDLLK